MRILDDRPDLSRWDPIRADATAWVPPERRTVIVVPHPDDEALSMGALIFAQAARDVEVVVLAVTDGDAAYDPDGDPVLAATRRAEQHDALALLGVGAGSTIRLGLPDSRVADTESALAASIGAHIDASTMVIAPWRFDVHPDHEAVGRAAAVAAATAGAMLFGSLFWAWHAGSRSSMPAGSLRAFAVTREASEAKRRAIEAHRSQFDVWEGEPPILDATLLEPATWPIEYYVAVDPST